MRWLVGFILHEMAFGLLSVFVPLYVTGVLGGSLIEVGLMAAAANFAAVPFSFFWGYLSDKTRRYRFFILLSFLGMAVLLLLFSLTRVIWLLIVVYVLVAIFHMAHEAPKNVLISEYYSRAEWEKSFASYEALTEVGWLLGLVLGFVLSLYGLGGGFIIIFCSSLNLLALVFSFFTVKDPVFVFERRLVSIEKALDFAHRGFSIASRAFDGLQVNENLRQESVSVFCGGLLVFSMATSMLFTPLPVFFSNSLGVTSSLVFGLFVFNTFGALMGYLMAGKKAEVLNGQSVVRKVVLLRSFLAWSLIATTVWFSVFTLAWAVVALMLIGVAYGFFLISTLSLSMELIPEGKAGAYNAIIGLGGAVGCFLGTFLAENYGFPTLFLVVGVEFILSYIAFKAYSQ